MAPASTKAPIPKRLELAEFLRAYAENFSSAVAYKDIPAQLRNDGWRWYLEQIQDTAGPHSTIVTFNLHVGKDGAPPIILDALSVAMAPIAGPLSLAARMQAEPIVIYLFTGRLPEAAEQRPAAPRQEDYTKKKAAMAEETDAGAQFMNGHETPAAKAIDVVAKRTPDGLPLFVDLYELGEPAVDVVDSVLAEVRDALPGVDSVEGVGALWSQNSDAMDFVSDFASPEQRAELKALFTDRKNALTKPAPRRRSAEAH